MDDDGKEEEAPDNATTDDEDDQTLQENTHVKGHAAAHAASVDDTADHQLHDPDNEPEDDTTEHSHQDLNEHPERSHDAESNRLFDEISNDNPEDELVPCVDHKARAMRQADDSFAASEIPTWISQAELDLLEAGNNDCQTPRRPRVQACLQLESSHSNQA